MREEFLKNEISTLLLNDYELIDYISLIISKACNLDLNFVRNNLEFISPKINANSLTKFSDVDAIYKNDNIYINIEVNTTKSDITDKKNMRYICNIVLKQVPPGKKDKYKKLYQINLDDYDYFGKNKFIYQSSIMEESLYIKRNDLFTIIDINLEYLRRLSYTDIKKEETNSLEQLLYIFICSDKEKREELYSKNELMDKVNEKLESLTNEYGTIYYDKEEYHKELVYELGTKDGIKKEKMEIAKKMLKENMDIKLIIKVTGLTKEEIEILKNDQK